MNIKLNKSQFEVVDGFLRQNKKIDAIKAVRDFFRVQGVSCFSLKEAKDAIERREWDLHLIQEVDSYSAGAGSRRGNAAAESQLVHRQPIRRIIVDFGEGELELDMDGLSLKAMSGLNGSIRIADALEMIDLYKRIKDWDDAGG